MIRPRQPAMVQLVQAADRQIVEAADAALGQVRSLAAGVQALRHADALFVGLADMPFVKVETLRQLATALRADPEGIVRPTHGDRPGHPVGFPARLFAALTELEGDMGARQVVANDPNVTLAASADTGIHRDVDVVPGSSETARADTA